MKAWGYILAVLLFVGAFFVGRWTKPRDVSYVELRDTVIVRDTVTERIPEPHIVEVVRIDTCWLETVADTVRVPVTVPIERKVYVTSDYRAVVEGYRPALVSMDIYRETQVITKSTAPRRWGVGIQVGYGYMPTVNKAAPYIGIGIQYSLWQW